MTDHTQKIVEQLDESYLKHFPTDKIGPLVIRHVEPLRGDASLRQYFRIQTSNSTILLMDLNGLSDDVLTDFFKITRFLKDSALPVPSLYHVDNTRRWIFLEDLGDETLENHLENASEKKIDDAYDKAIDLLLSLQIAGSRSSDKECPVYQRAFDVDKLMFEMDFMIEHFIGGMLKIDLESRNLKILRNELHEVCLHLASLDRIVCHRDYHCRNLMLKRGDLFMIDYQDARMGPRQYDLSSLLRDSYFRLDWKQVLKKIDRFVSGIEEHSGKKIDRENFLKDFDLMSCQRNLKAIGTFACQSLKGNDRYSPSIRPTLKYVKESLLRQKILSSFEQLLSGTDYDLGSL